ncbi:Plasmodium exported protein, unknown function [Plasmodium malariae]|uniref:Fam-m protein n=1 Tax=Plasmodium malariae TaxID=5858 RepID=A0A1D3JL24_PLAMA|nr:Plasmodium exported protein, unknown function [Plasmodium malariae]SBT87290.1 Plasmodium exported protein, unknown function [Plasmodium malariae]
MCRKMKYFILIKTFMFILFFWESSYFINVSAFDKPLDNINNENGTLGLGTDILLSDSKKEVKNIELNCTLFGNGYYDLENDNNRDESTYDGTYECKKKNNLKTEAKKLNKKYISVVCQPFVTIDNLFEKILYKRFRHIYNYRKCTDPMQKKSLKRSAFTCCTLLFALPGIFTFIGVSLLFVLHSRLVYTLLIQIPGDFYEVQFQTFSQLVEKY